MSDNNNWIIALQRNYDGWQQLIGKTNTMRVAVENIVAEQWSKFDCALILLTSMLE